jgi:hypothetical protein
VSIIGHYRPSFTKANSQAFDNHDHSERDHEPFSKTAGNEVDESNGFGKRYEFEKLFPKIGSHSSPNKRITKKNDTKARISTEISSSF